MPVMPLPGWSKLDIQVSPFLFSFIILFSYSSMWHPYTSIHIHLYQSLVAVIERWNFPFSMQHFEMTVFCLPFCLQMVTCQNNTYSLSQSSACIIEIHFILQLKTFNYLKGFIETWTLHACPLTCIDSSPLLIRHWQTCLDIHSTLVERLNTHLNTISRS